MIVPENRLLWLTSLTLPPAALAVAVFPAVEPFAWALAVLYAGVCLLDGLAVMRCGEGMQADFPVQLNIARGREDVFPFRVRNGKRGLRSLRVGLGLPEGLTSPCEVLQAAVPAGDDWVRVEWPITALRRGEYLVTGCGFRASSLLGLWSRQWSMPVEARVRVHADLRREYRRLAASFLHRDKPGLHALRQIGKGRDFEKLREYLPGDAVNDVHWKATAKRGRLVTKEYQVERTQEVYVVLDASRLSALRVEGPRDMDGTVEDCLLDRYISAALTFGDLAQRWGDKFGLVTFDSNISRFVRAGRGRSHFRVCREALFGLSPRPVTPDYDELAVFLLMNLRRRAMLLFLTSLDDPALAESFVHGMGPVGRRHIVIVAMVRSPSARPLFSDSNVEGLDDVYRHLGGHLQWQSLRELEKVLMRSGIGFSLVGHQELCLEMVSRYLAVKGRQIL